MDIVLTRRLEFTGFGQPANTGFGSSNTGGGLFGNTTNTNTAFGGTSTGSLLLLASGSWSNRVGLDTTQPATIILYNALPKVGCH